MQLDEYEEAVKCLQKIMSLDPKHAEGKAMLAKAIA